MPTTYPVLVLALGIDIYGGTKSEHVNKSINKWITDNLRYKYILERQ